MENAEEDEEILGGRDGSGIRRSEWQLMISESWEIIESRKSQLEICLESLLGFN